MKLLITLFLLAASIGKPTITTKGDTEHFTVTFSKGAVSACTEFQEQVVRNEDRNIWPDGRYKPAHCWLLDETTTSYDDDWHMIKKYDSDWKVWAEITYLNNGKTTTINTNVISTHR